MDKPQINCNTCDELVSIDASKCPHCGQSYVTRELALGTIFVALPLLCLLLVPVMLAITPSVMLDDIGGLSGVILLVGVVYALFSGLVWHLYRERKTSIAEAESA